MCNRCAKLGLRSFFENVQFENISQSAARFADRTFRRKPHHMHRQAESGQSRA
jgi:hypothetical protein